MNQDEIKFYTLIKSNGIELPATTNDIELTMSDLQADTITSWLDGKTKLNTKRKDIVSMPLSWQNIPVEQMNLILANTCAQEDGGSNIEYYDPISNQRVVKRMYRSDRQTVLKLYKGGMYADLSFDLTEM